MQKVLIFLFFVCSLSADYRLLDDLALKAQADKASSWHNYTQVYARYFAPLRERRIKFLEIGIWKGNSVKLWEDYFPNAELHFIDIYIQQDAYTSARARYHRVDQANPRELQRFIQETGGAFDVIIDDGGHTMQQQIVSFEQLFPHLKSGGIYIIEDLHTSNWPHFGGGKHRGTTIAFLKGLIDEVNFVGARTGRASHQEIDPSIKKELNVMRETIESIHFYDSLAIIFKR